MEINLEIARENSKPL